MHETTREVTACQVPTNLLLDEVRHGLVVRLIGLTQERSTVVSHKPQEHRRVRVAGAIRWDELSMPSMLRTRHTTVAPPVAARNASPTPRRSQPASKRAANSVVLAEVATRPNHTRNVATMEPAPDAHRFHLRTGSGHVRAPRHPHADHAAPCCFGIEGVNPRRSRTTGRMTRVMVWLIATIPSVQPLLAARRCRLMPRRYPTRLATTGRMTMATVRRTATTRSAGTIPSACLHHYMARHPSRIRTDHSETSWGPLEDGGTR